MSDQKVTSPHNFEISSGRKVTQREIKISTTAATAQWLIHHSDCKFWELVVKEMFDRL